MKNCSRSKEIVTPYAAPYNRHIDHVYAVRVPERDRVIEALAWESLSPGVNFTTRGRLESYILKQAGPTHC